jgi:GST-like protein
MIDFYTWATPNGRKISIMLEEARLDYAVKPINIETGEQHSPEFVRISPNAKIPAIVDHDAPGGPMTVFESGAILMHLAEKAGAFLPAEPRQRSECLQWLFWQVGGLGPMVGQFNWYRRQTGPEFAQPFARFTEEAVRLFKVLDARLGEAEYAAGGAYTIADMAIYPWSIYGRRRTETASGLAFPNIERWERKLALRPALARGMAVPAPPT